MPSSRTGSRSPQREDAALTRLLRASLATCEAYIGQVPIETAYEEIHPAVSGWQTLGLRPVRSLTQLEGIDANGDRFAIAADQALFDIQGDGSGRFRLLTATDANQLAVQYSAGIAPGWDSLPEGLCHGIMRLAAFHFRARENDATGAMPPAAISALWQPWRRMRLA